MGMRRTLFLLIVGLGGAAILIWLGVWQIQRLAWKESVIEDIEARIAAAPVAVPDTPDPAEDAYLPVTVSGVWDPDFVRVLVSQKEVGAGYRVISRFETEAGPVLVDRGFIPTDQDIPDLANREASVIGNLQWPQEIDGFTPEPDVAKNIWFARDVPALAEALGTRPLMIVAREVSPVDPAVTPLPVDTSRIPNDHLQYAITWFSLAAVWLVMTLTFMLRRRSPQSES